MSTKNGDSHKTVFITGAAGGLGASTARYLAEHDWMVFAADYDAKALEELENETNIYPLRVDVTDAQSCEAARRKVASMCRGLDGIVNFAGILAVGSLVEIDPETVRRVLEVNVMGTVRVNHALFRHVLARKGRIVNISSETGWQTAMPFNGPYAMSKHAIEAYSDALRRELMFLDIPVIKIQPGPFRTGMVASIEENFDRVTKSSKYFKGLLNNLKKATVKEQDKAHDPLLLARTVHDALTDRWPRAAYSVKPDPQRIALNQLPEWSIDQVLKRLLRN